MLALFMIPALILAVSGKYRLLMKPRQADASKRNAAALNPPAKPVTTGNNSSRVSGRNHPEADLESLLQMYTVDFYRSRMECPDSPDEAVAVSGNSRARRLPAVEIPGSIRLIAGLDGEKGYVPRLEAVNALGSDLSAMEVTALLFFLHKKIPDDVLEPLEFNAVKNNTVTLLMRQSRLPEELAPHLVAMYYDKTLDNTWRDYCIQFMGQWYGSIHVPSEQAHVREALDAALSDSDNIPAAAIIAMGGLAGNPGFSHERISTAALRLCTDPGTGDTVKTASLQICAKLKNREILPVARDIMKTSENVPLKMSAIAVVGAIGDSSDRDTLRSFVKSGDVRMRTASKAALKKMGVN